VEQQAAAGEIWLAPGEASSGQEVNYATGLEDAQEQDAAGDLPPLPVLPLKYPAPPPQESGGGGQWIEGPSFEA
jgi:hypothetical protein